MSIELHKQMSIPELISAVRMTMLRLRYSSATLCIYDCIWKDFTEYCNRQNIAVFDETIGNRFALECYGHQIGDTCNLKDDFRKKTVGRAMQHLLDYQNYGVIFQLSNRDNYQWHVQYRQAFDEYVAQMIRHGYAKSTLQTIKSCLAGFHEFLLQKNVRSLMDLTRNDIEAFLLTFSKYARSTLPNRIYYLRIMLDYFYRRGFTEDNLSRVCPHVKYGQYANSLPSFFTADEVSRILAAIDRESPVGKRDYAFILLIVKLGIRSVDAIHLRFSDIDWHAKQVHIFQSKTKGTVTLPLVEDVGWAIIDYLQNARPKTSCENIFVKHIPVNGYYGEFETNPYSILQKYLSRAHISTEYKRKHGLHALRHSLASELLQHDTPLPIISGILGHTNTNTTSVYLKIDMKMLKKCALEVEYENK